MKSVFSISIYISVILFCVHVIGCVDDSGDGSSEADDTDNNVNDDANDVANDDLNDDADDDEDVNDDQNDDVNDDVDDDADDDVNDDMNDDIDDDVDDDVNDDTPECVDEDGDGYGDNCEAGPDCDDTDNLIHPGAPEIPGDGVDQDCDEADPLLNDNIGIFVSMTGDDGNPGTMTAPLRTINAGAILALQAGKSVFVATGEYTEDVITEVSLFGGYESVGWTRDIDLYVTTINAEATTAVNVGAATTLRDGGRDGDWQGAKVDDVNLVVVQGFTIKGGSEIVESSGIFNWGALLLVNNIISGGDGESFISGVFNYGGTATLVNNTISCGSGEYSIGVYNYCDYYDIIHGTMTLVNNTITGGSGELYCIGVANLGTLTLTNNNIDAGLCTDTSVGVGSYRGTAELLNNTIDGGSGAVLSAGILQDDTLFPSEISLIHNNIWGQDQLFILADGTSIQITDIADLNACLWDGCVEAFENISADPLFVDPDAGNFHLQNVSPCIDTGIDPVPTYIPPGFVDFDFEGDARPYGSGWDIGVDEWKPQQ